MSFGRDIRPLLDRPSGEAGCSCHRPNGFGHQLGGFNIASLETIRQGGLNTGAQVILPGDPCASLLVHKLSEAPPVGARMPLDGPPYLSVEERQLVHDWIAEGADDD